jgi:ABC-2 type transport system permease protein
VTALVQAEVRKLTTTRLWLWMLVLGLVTVGGTTSAAIGFDTARQRTVFAQATATLVVVRILGIIRWRRWAASGISIRRRFWRGGGVGPAV